MAMAVRWNGTLYGAFFSSIDLIAFQRRFGYWVTVEIVERVSEGGQKLGALIALGLAMQGQDNDWRRIP